MAEVTKEIFIEEYQNFTGSDREFAEYLNEKYKRMETAHEKDVWNAHPSGLCRRHCVVLECIHNGSN